MLSNILKDSESIKIFAVRFSPGQDLKKELIHYATTHKILAGSVVTCVGSLKKAQIRMANAQNIQSLDGPFEIVSLVGTLEPGYAHLHIALSDHAGQVIGGHLMNGCEVHTTCEVVILEDLTRQWNREPDPQTGYNELKINPRS